MSDLPHISPFEAIRKVAENGSEYWSAHDLSKILGYSEWRNFTTAIEKAKEACQNSGQAISDHFVGFNKMITAAKGAKRKTDDYHLSRYACYLTVANSDPSKPIVALGQAYFAVQTDAKLRRENIAGKENANRTHHEVGREVRETIKRLAGTLPEDLPTPEKSIKQLQQEEQERLKQRQQPLLLDEPERIDEADS